MVIKNAMLYSASLYNYNADVVTDLTGSSDSDPYFII